MKRLIMAVVLAAVAPALAQPQTTRATVNGYVIDSACLFIKNLEKPVSRQCAIDCAKSGSPLVILADDGTIYLPISGDMPATGQNARLMDFAGERVVVSGKVFERGGSHAIVIEEIKAALAAK